MTSDPIEIAPKPRKTLVVFALLELVLLIPLLLAVTAEIFDVGANGRWFADITPELFLTISIGSFFSVFLLKFIGVEPLRVQARVRVYCGRNEFDKAHRLIERKLTFSLKPFRPVYMGTKVWLLIKEGRYGEALPLARKLTDEAPSYPFGWYLLAYIQSRMGDLESAEISLKKALNLFKTEAKNPLLRRKRDKLRKDFIQNLAEDRYLKDLVDKTGRN